MRNANPDVDENEYASAALAGLSAFGCTPEKGYVKDGGVALMTADFRRAKEKFTALQDQLASLRAAATALVEFHRESDGDLDNQHGDELVARIKAVLDAQKGADHA